MVNTGELSKDSLRENFSKDYKRYYSTKLFDEMGFSRHRCRICGKNFWSVEKRDLCEDPSHTEYSFFSDRPKNMGYKSFWDRFAKFFRDNKHTVIDRYPVVSRWRPDLYFTIASIQDFQRIENGVMNFEYGANPLIVPQICLRFSDIENVGITGRHFTSFMMAGQHSFNYPEEGYWRDRTIELNFDFLTKVLGVKKENLVYNEDVWAMGDFSEFGPCLESFANGLELVNSVFTEFESVNGNVVELKRKVVDVGWGFERLVWFYTGKNNAYEAIFGDIAAKIEKDMGADFDRTLFRNFSRISGELDVTEVGASEAREMAILKKMGITGRQYNERIKPLSALYALLDHTRTLLFAVSDGALPSNIGGGYNLRVILRRCFSFIDEYKIGTGVEEIAEMEAKELHGMYPELQENLDMFRKIVDVERKRYGKSRENAERIVDSIISKRSRFEKSEMKTLYESNGITPEIIATVAAKKNVRIELPFSSYLEIVKGDFSGKRKEEQKIKDALDVKQLPATKILYYDFETESDSKIIYSHKNYVVLDRTPFYPEGGGQAADTGTINNEKVVDVQKVGHAVVHVMENDVSGEKGMGIGKGARCRVDIDRRNRLMAHHTATHLISAAARNVLGKHAWQEGARKEADKAHIDIAHYEKLTKEEIGAIENFANDAIFRGIKVSIEELERGEAEKRYGFTIYQGHGVPAKKMRIVVIRDRDGNVIDAEACGGLHLVGNESDIGIVKIIDTYRIHDGIDRIEFVAGKAALDYFRNEHDALAGIGEALNVQRFGSLKRIEAMQEEMKEVKKMADGLAESLAGLIVDPKALEHVVAEAAMQEGASVMELDYPREILRKIAAGVVEKHKSKTVLLRNKRGDVVCISGDDSRFGAIDLAKEQKGFTGGGSRKAAEGKIV